MALIVVFRVNFVTQVVKNHICMHPLSQLWLVVSKN